MKCGNLVEIRFRLNLVVKGFKETKWTGLLARTRALFLKKIVIAVFDFGPEKRALHYTMIHGGTAKKKDNDLTWPHSVSSASA